MELFTDTQVTQMPDPEWLIEKLFPTGSFVVLYGPSEHGKSFVALDWAFHIATGKPWQGLPVKQGPVVYIAAEGRGGLGQRITAWKATYQPASTPVYFSLQPLDILEDGPDELIGACALFAPYADEPETDLCPSLVIVDTLARCMTGDENETKDMSQFVRGIDTLRQDLGATVLMVHHTGKDLEREERGSSVLRGAADTMIRVKRSKQDDSILLKCSKQKDAARFEDITLRLRSVGDSCIIAPGYTMEQALKTVEGDDHLSLRGKARRIAELTGLPVENCRNWLRGLAN